MSSVLGITLRRLSINAPAQRFLTTASLKMKVLNVAEKNDAAKNIAGLLSRGTSNKREGYSKFNKIYDFTCDVPQLGGQCYMTMTSVSGHLMDFDFESTLNNWRAVQPATLFDAPIHEGFKSGNKTGPMIKRTLEREARGCQALIIWTDGDREGENIGFEIIRVCHQANRNLRILRARFSEITARSMAAAINNLVDPDESMSKAVDIRRELDLRLGAVFTRFQTLLMQRAGHLGSQEKCQLVSYGPCQFPTLGFVVNRYLEIINFRSQPFWLITVEHRKDNIKVPFNWKRHRLFEESACLAFYSRIMECPKARVTNVVGKSKSRWRPEPMYTTSMEKLASIKLRLAAKETMRIAEKLYTQGFISYPRTETNIFPKGMNLTKIVEDQTRHPAWGAFAQKIMSEGGPRPRVGKKTDNAHPPIHPTKYTNDLSGVDAKLYELITRHFLACVSKDAIGAETVVTIDMNGETFTANGLIILELNYLEVYTYDKWNAKEMPQFLINEEFVPDVVMMTDGKTCPPQLLSEAELISLMEKHGIGTDATHAEHIDTIQKRNYIKKLPKNNRFCPTKLSLALYDGYNSIQLTRLVKPELRCRLEQDLVRISENRRCAREVAQEYIDEHKDVYRVVNQEQQKLIDAFLLNKNMIEPELRLKNLLPGEYR